MRHKPTINIRPGIGVGLIIKRKTGVIISNQTGGYACNHPSIEGFYIPLLPENHSLLDKWFREGGYQCSTNNGGLDEKDVSFIDDFLDDLFEGIVLRVDRERLAESEEAWIHLDIVNTTNDTEFDQIAAFGTCKGILTWENSD